jgi:MIP family channel proteins
VRRLVLRALPMEILGTFALCYVGGMSCVMADNGQIGLDGVALAHGGILTLFVYIGADISGAHFNPAVSIGIFLLGKEPFIKMMMYGCAQLIGGIIAGAFISFNLSTGFVSPMLKPDHTVLGYPNMDSAHFDRWQALMAELVCTMILCVGIFFATENWKHHPKRKGNFALCIGMILTTCIYAVGNISGGALNPARMVGPMIVSGTVQTPTSPYIGGTLAGAIIAAFFYKTFLQFDKDDEKSSQLEGETPEQAAQREQNLKEEYQKNRAA